MDSLPLFSMISLSSPSGDKLKNRDECKNLQVECLLALEQWERAATMLGEMIRATPDQWIYIQHYISCQVKRCKIKRREEIASSKKEVGSKEAGGEGDQPEGAADSLPHDCGTGGCDEKGESWSDLRSVEIHISVCVRWVPYQVYLSSARGFCNGALQKWELCVFL